MYHILTIMYCSQYSFFHLFFSHFFSTKFSFLDYTYLGEFGRYFHPDRHAGLQTEGGKRSAEVENETQLLDKFSTAEFGPWIWRVFCH